MAHLSTLILERILNTLSSKGNISAPREVQPRKVTSLSNFDNIGISAEDIRSLLKSPQVLGANHFVWTCHPVFREVSEKKDSNKGSEQRKHLW